MVLKKIEFESFYGEEDFEKIITEYVLNKIRVMEIDQSFSKERENEQDNGGRKL